MVLDTCSYLLTPEVDVATKIEELGYPFSPGRNEKWGSVGLSVGGLALLPAKFQMYLQIGETKGYLVNHGMDKRAQSILTVGGQEVQPLNQSNTELKVKLQMRDRSCSNVGL